MTVPQNIMMIIPIGQMYQVVWWLFCARETDVVTFDDGSSVTCIINSKSVAKQLKLKNNFNGTVKINDNKRLTIREHFAIYNGSTLELGTDSTLITQKKTSYIYSGGTLSAINAKEVKIFAVLDIKVVELFLLLPRIQNF